MRIELEQIADGVGILLPIESPHQNAPAAHASQLLGLLELRSNPLHDRKRSLRIGSRFVFRRHRTAVDLMDDLVPIIRGRAAQEIGAELINTESSLSLLGIMTRVAMPLQKWQHVAFKLRRCRERRRR